MATIQIWNNFGPIEIPTDIRKSKFTINVNPEAQPLPESLEKEVNSNWKETQRKNPNAKNNTVLYLIPPKPEQTGQEVQIHTNARGFKYTQAYNRNKDWHQRTDELNAHKLLTLSTHCSILTQDNKLLFGTKRNQSNQISQFSGFPNVEEDCVTTGERRTLDVYGTILNRLRPEIGSLVDAVDSITALGITYVDTPGLRGTDTDYVAKIDVTADRAQQLFQETAQFQKQLFQADFEPDKIREFVKNITRQGKTMSRYALGCLYLATNAYFGEKEAEKFKRTITRNIKESISTKNTTGYFK